MNPEQSEVTPELKNLILNFVGQTYGEMHKLDKDIVQSATNLQPASDILRARAPGIINSVLPQRAQSQFDQPAFTSAPHPQVSTQVPQYDPNQLEFNFASSEASSKLLSIANEINTNLQRIAVNLDVIIEKLSN